MEPKQRKKKNYEKVLLHPSLDFSERIKYLSYEVLEIQKLPARAASIKIVHLVDPCFINYSVCLYMT